MAELTQSIKYFLRKTFDIREGEIRQVFLMQANIFLIISTLLIVKPTVNALFLSKFGVESLPNAFILVAIVAAIVSSLYARLILRSPLDRIMRSTLVFSVICLVLFGVFLRLNILESFVLYLFYIWVAIFALLATSQFWILANLIFNTREAKRLFGFIGSGAIAGGIFGGYLTSVFSTFMSSEYLLFLSAFLLTFCIPITIYIWKHNVVESYTALQQHNKSPEFSQHPFFLIRKSKHLTYIACIVGVSVLVAKLVDYQFGGLASSLISDPDELTAFFGFWFSTFNVISLLLQLFVTRRIVGHFGVGISLFLLPGAIMFAVIILLVMPELLMAAVFLKMADGGLKQSVNKASMELLIMPLPTELKKQTKTFIDVFVDSLATGISGLLLIFVIRGLSLSPVVINWIIVFLLLIWLYFAGRVRSEYLKAFKIKIDQFNSRIEKKAIDLQNESVLGGIRKVLANGDEKQILFLLQKIRETPDDRLFESIRHLLTHSSNEVRAEALRNLYFFKNQNLSGEIGKLTTDSFQKVKIAAFEYLIRHMGKESIQVMKTYLSDPDYKVSSAAIISIAREAANNPALKNTFYLKDHILSRQKKLETVNDPDTKKFLTITLLKTSGYSNIPETFFILENYMNHPDAEIAKQAIIGAGQTRSTYFLDLLINLLQNSQYKDHATQALLLYGHGIVNILASLVKSPETSLDTIRAIPGIVKKIGYQKSVDFLFELLDFQDFVVYQEALRGLNVLRNNYQFLNFNKKTILFRILAEAELYQNTLFALKTQNTTYTIQSTQVHSEINQKRIAARNALIDLLNRRLGKSIERIFRLLGLQYPPDDIFNIYKSLQSTQPDLHINALEFLDNLIAPKLKKVLIPIVESSMLETISEEAAKKIKSALPGEYECFKLLLKGKDYRVQLAVIYLISQLKDEKYHPLLVEQSNSNNHKIRVLAHRALNEHLTN